MIDSNTLIEKIIKNLLIFWEIEFMFGKRIELQLKPYKSIWGFSDINSCYNLFILTVKSRNQASISYRLDKLFYFLSLKLYILTPFEGIVEKESTI